MSFMPLTTLTDNAPIHPGRPAKSNREIFRVTRSPLCEWSPERRDLAMLSDPFHCLAVAEVAAGLPEVPVLRLCGRCSQEFPRGRRAGLR